MLDAVKLPLPFPDTVAVLVVGCHVAKTTNRFPAPVAVTVQVSGEAVAWFWQSLATCVIVAFAGSATNSKHAARMSLFLMA